MIVLCRVTIRRIIAAAVVAAGHAKPQMDPSPAHLQTLLATIGAGHHLNDLTDVFAIFHSVDKGVAKFYA